MERHSLVEYLDSFQQRGRDCAYVYHRGYRTERWSYRRIAETAFQFARELETRQISKGDHVVIWGENCAEWVVVFWGCVLRGAVVVPMDNVAAADFALRVCEQVGAKLLVCSREHGRRSAALPAVIPQTIILEDLCTGVARHSGTTYPVAPSSRDDALEIVFTSGTTAEPKGVVITHGNVLANIAPLEHEIRN